MGESTFQNWNWLSFWRLIFLVKFSFTYPFFSKKSFFSKIHTMLKKTTFLFLLKICAISGIFGQKRGEFSLFFYPNDPMEFRTLSTQEFMNLEKNPKPYFLGGAKSEITVGFSAGFWTKNRFLLHELEFNSRQMRGGNGKNWVLPPVPDSLENVSSMKNWRFSGQYALFFNLFPTYRRVAFYPGAAIRPIVSGYFYKNSATPTGFEKQKSAGVDLIFCPRMSFRFSQKCYFDATIQVLNLENRVFRQQKHHLDIDINERNFFWKTRFFNCVSRFGLTFRF
jgi:hypothetical protein